MFKHLKFIDGTSDKFWEIQTDGALHTVTYGRNGTSGQGKTKMFDSPEACLKDAEKLVSEKMKKGYSEDGQVDTVSKVKVLKSGPALAKAQQKEEAVTTIKNLIRKGKIADVVPYLEQYASGNLQVIKKEIHAARRYWMDYVDLSNEPQFWLRTHQGWGRRGTNEQYRIINLLALGTFSASDATVSFRGDFHQLLEEAKSPDVAAVLAFAKPTWLSTYLSQSTALENWWSISYLSLRYLEEQGYVEFEPELYARSITTFRHEGSNQLFRMVTEDELAIQRDVPLVLEYETGLHNSYWNYNYQDAVHVYTWDKIFAKLLDAGKLDEERLLTGALQAQTKNWSTGLKSYFRKVISNLQLSEEKVIQYQHKFFPLLHAEQSAVINFTVDYLKPFFVHVDFHLQEFLDWGEGIFMRSDVKVSLKSLLIQFDKIIKIKPEFQGRLVSLSADIFMIPDLQLQERVSKFLCKHQKEPNQDLAEKLQIYKPQMMGSVAADLQYLFSTHEGYTEAEILSPLNDQSVKQYTYNPTEVRRLNEAYVYPESWNDLFFKVGEVIGGSDPIQVEILMNAWIQNTAVFPSDYKTQLAPYIKQATTQREASWYNHFSHVFVNMYYKPHMVHHNNDRYSNYSKWVSLLGHQLGLLQCYLIDGIRLPLLSLPTHRPFWIAPVVLVQRILDYQSAGVKVDLLDFSIALSRTVREDVNNLSSLIDQINDVQVQEVLRYAFGLEDTIKTQRRSWFNNLISGKNADALLWIGVWATVGRTHHPDACFEEFKEDALKDIPFAVQPFRPLLAIEPVYYDSYNYATKKTESVYNGDKLSYPLPSYKNGINTFLYHKDIFNRGNNNIAHFYLYRADVSYMHSLMPQNTESLSLFLTIAFNDKSDTGGKSSAAYLREMLYDFFRFDQQSYLYLATSFFNKEKEVRAMSVEVLLEAISSSRLDMATLGQVLGRLLSSGYGPIGRCTEVFEQCRDISSMHNHALLQLLDATFIFYTVGDKMPTNFKKIVEYYYNLLHKEQYPIPEELNAVFEQLERYKSLQPILRKIKK